MRARNRVVLNVGVFEMTKVTMTRVFELVHRVLVPALAVALGRCPSRWPLHLLGVEGVDQKHARLVTVGNLGRSLDSDLGAGREIGTNDDEWLHYFGKAKCTRRLRVARARCGYRRTFFLTA